MGMNMTTLVNRNKDALSELERHLGYRFTDLRLLQQALVHASYAFEQSGSGNDNQILEYLGDAVLDLTIGHLLTRRYPDMREGELTRFRASLVNEGQLAEMARGIELGTYLCLGKGEESTSGRNKNSILACAFEAVIGAVFEDSGYDTVEDLVEHLFGPVVETKKAALMLADAKSRLQEVLQEQYNEPPTYRIDSEEGPSHDRVFTVSVVFQGRVMSSGTAKSKKEAEQRAAAAALAAYGQSGGHT